MDSSHDKADREFLERLRQVIGTPPAELDTAALRAVREQLSRSDYPVGPDRSGDSAG